eukprot:scaffold133722_cov26-Tisochrysis_lutea.AAC.1
MSHCDASTLFPISTVQAGEMLGETSLLKEGRATAAVAADADTTVIAIDGRSLEQLFSTNARLPSRFFCFLATYQGERLYKLTQSFAESQKPLVTISASLAISIEEVGAPHRARVGAGGHVWLKSSGVPGGRHATLRPHTVSNVPRQVIHNPAYCGVLRKYLLRSEADAAEA